MYIAEVLSIESLQVVEVLRGGLKDFESIELRGHIAAMREGA